MNTTQITETPGQALRRYFRVGPRTRRYRDGMDLHAEMLDAINLAATMPGYYVERTEQALRPAFGAYLAIDKHINGYRVSGGTIARVRALSPYRFAALIDEMVAAGVQTTGAGEEFFRAYERRSV